MSGVTGLSLHSIDVLSGINSLKICTAYKYNDEVMESFPASLNILAKCEPIYEELPGWSEDITKVKSLEELPENARQIIERIILLTGIPVSIFSVGPERDQTIVVNKVFQP
ncbi:adenylosuccinate synthase [Paenibacillus sp. V4I7]|nr:adenylosuccinate synthase [Paenibacillus sp. V4I7]MDQ0919536.1 adenylosuccinate synthase [Paenibacillus sp. V4I5]